MNFVTFNPFKYLVFLVFLSVVIPFLNGQSRNNTLSRWTNQEIRILPKVVNRNFLVRANSVSPEAKMTTVEIIANRGYPVETHTVTSDDGYILELHRITYGQGQSSDLKIKRRAVYLQHGIMNSDNIWLINPNDQALAYILADKGYDVWLGNSRGSTYSRKHVSLDPAQSPYWNFSFDESGKYDIPAVINYILGKTGRTTMSYVGHSMGCAMFFVCMHYHPELNAKIDVMIALAPAAAMANAQTSIRYQAPFVNQLMTFYRLMNVNVYQPLDTPQNNFRRAYCGPSLFLRRSICRNPLFNVFGDDYRTLDPNILPVIDGHNPAGTSVKTPAHFAQIYNAGQTFQLYDYGFSENQQRYGQSTPPAYDLSKVTCPVHIYWGQNDKTAAPGDVAWLASKLGNLKSSNQVKDPLWNHKAFLLSPDAKRLVYDEFIPLLPSTPI